MASELYLWHKLAVVVLSWVIEICWWIKSERLERNARPYESSVDNQFGMQSVLN